VADFDRIRAYNPLVAATLLATTVKRDRFGSDSTSDIS